MNNKIVSLPREKWKGYPIPIGYTTNEYYDVEIDKTDGFTISIKKKPFAAPVNHSQEEHDYPDKLYAPYWEKAYAWGVVEGDKLLAAIETCPEEWSNRLRITELWVDETLRRQGVGKALIDIAKEQARLERRRAIILETQSCNVNAIGFYLSQGFTLIGFDSCCYANNDLERKEVRLELGILRNKPERIKPGEIEIRTERPADYFETEQMVRRAFFNKHHPGCNEHFLVHKLRSDDAYIPELSRIAVADGRIVGTIMYSKAKVIGDREHNVITFGPLCVDPDYQGRGIGELLLLETVKLARNAGFSGIVIYGEPDYYPLHGFERCDKFGITTPDGKNFDSFMAYKLNTGFDEVHGKFHEASVFENLKDGFEDFDNKFPYMQKLRFPTQWPD
jgi:predicted N-acetyltransferase YhbS